MPKGVTNAAKASYRGGKWNVNYLRFLTDFMDELKLPMATIAETAGLTRQTIYYWLTKDDAKLSSVLNLFDSFEYDLIFDLVKSRPQGEADVDIFVRREKGTKRLSFLDDCLRRYKVNRAQMLRDMQLSHATLGTWLKADDIFISYIYRIAETCGLTVKITIRPKETGIPQA